MKTTLTLALVLGIAFGTAGCASGTPSTAPTSPATEEPSATPSPTPPPVPTPTPTPTEQAAPEAERLIVSGEAIVVLAGDGSELASYDYLQDTAELVSGFTQLFGREPAETPFEGSSHSPGGVAHEWDGFILADIDGDAAPPYRTNHTVRITVPEVGGIEIVTGDGFGVGSAVADVLAEPGTEEAIRETGATYLNLQVDQVVVAEGEPECPEQGCQYSVLLHSDDAAERIVWLAAPSRNFGV